MMRIAYVSLHWPRLKSSGVGKKISSQISAWREAGHEVEFFMHSAACESLADLVPGRYFFYPKAGKWRTEFNRIQAARSLLNAMRAYQPDVIYLRYGMYVYPIHRLAEIAPVVEEITTNDLNQHEGLGRIEAAYNRLTRGLMLRRVSGAIYLSHELASFPFNAKYGKPFAVVGDSADLRGIPSLPAPNNPAPQIAFIGSPGSLWQGVDKLPSLARRFPDLEIHVIGYDRIDGAGELPRNLRLRGYLKAADYQKILAQMDCAISSLALHRIHLNESSPLKTRECLAYGLPMVLPYKDTDLDSLQADWLLKIPNREDNVETHGQAIRDFAYRMRGRRAEREALAFLDSRHKERRRLEFFEEVLRRAKEGKR